MAARPVAHSLALAEVLLAASLSSVAFLPEVADSIEDGFHLILLLVLASAAVLELAASAAVASADSVVRTAVPALAVL